MAENENIDENLDYEEIPNSDIEYHDNGVIKLERIKITETLIKHVHYDIKGQIKKIVDYDNLGNVKNTIELNSETAQNGLSFTYYENGNVQSLKYFINGKINWVEKIFDNDGQLLEVITYNKGIKNGPHTVYSKRNAKLSEVQYSENKPSGKAKYYYETGELKAEVHFQNGKKEGVSKFFHKNGNLRKKELLKDGIKDGETTLYYENGAIKEKWNYELGKLSNEALKYNMDGEVVKKLYYHEGTEVEEIQVAATAPEVTQSSRKTYPYEQRIPQVEKKETPKETPPVEEIIQPTLPEPKVEIPVEKPAVMTKEEIRRRKVKLAVNYTMLFIGSLILMYVIYSLVIYLL